MWTKTETMPPSNLLLILCFPFLLHGVPPVTASMSATPTLGDLKTSQPKPAPNSEGASVRPKPAKVEVVRGTTFYKYDEESYRREMEYQVQNMMDSPRRFGPIETPQIQSSVDEMGYKNAGEVEDYFVADYDNVDYFYQDVAPDEKKAEGVDMLQFLEDFLEESETVAGTVKSEEQMQETVKEHYSREGKVDKEVEENVKISATHFKSSAEPVSVQLNDVEIQLRNDDFQEEEFVQAKQIQSDSQWDFNELTEEEFLSDEFWDGKSDTEIVQLILKYSQVSPEDLQTLLFQPEQSEEYLNLTPTQDTQDTPINHELFLDDSLVRYNEDLMDEELRSVIVSEGVSINKEENVPLKHELLPKDDSVNVDLDQKQIQEGVSHKDIPDEQTLEDEMPPSEYYFEDEKLDDKHVPVDVPAIHDQSLVPASLNNEQISPNQNQLLPGVQDSEQISENVPRNLKRIPEDVLHVMDTLELAPEKQESVDVELLDHEHPSTNIETNHEQIPGDNPDGPQFLSKDEEISTEQLTDEVRPVQKLNPEHIQPSQEQLVQEQILGSIPLNHERVREDVPLVHEHLSTNIEINHEQIVGDLIPEVIRPSQERLGEEQTVDVELLDNEHISTNIETNHEQILGRDKPDDPEFLPKDIESRNEHKADEVPAVQKLIQPPKEQNPEDVQLENNEQIPGDVPLHHEVVVDIRHTQSDLEANAEEMDSEFTQNRLLEGMPLNYELFLEEMTENVIDLSDETIENQRLILELTKIELSQSEDVFTTIQKHKQRLSLTEDYHDRSNLTVEHEIEKEKIDHERVSRDAEHPELNWNDEEKVFASVFALDPEFEQQYQEMKEDIQLPNIESQSQNISLEIDKIVTTIDKSNTENETVVKQPKLDAQLKINPELEIVITPLNPKDEVKNENTSKVTAKQVVFQEPYESEDDSRLTVKEFVQNEIKENLQSADEKDVLLINTENGVLIDSSQLELESTFSKFSLETIDGDPSLEQLPVSNMVTFENSSLPNDSSKENDFIPGGMLNEDKGPSVEIFEVLTSHDKHDEDEYVEWLMQFIPSRLHSWSHGVSYSTLFGDVSGDRAVLLLIVAGSFLVIFVVNQFLIVSNREKPLIARMAQMDKKLFSTTKALEQERVERCEAKLECENQCKHVQRLNEKCRELEEELNMVRMEKADAVDKSTKADSLLQIKSKEETEQEDHREQLVELVSELQVQSQAHKTLLDNYESIIKKKENELENIWKENKELKEDVETDRLELDKARKECLEFKDIIDQHLENDTNQKNTIELIKSQLMDKESSIERMETELRTLKGRLLTLENEDEIKSSKIDELKEMLIIMEESGMTIENQDSTPNGVKELAKLRLRERVDSEGELKKDILDAKEKLAHVEFELSIVKKENEFIRATRDEALKKEEDALNKLDVLTEFFKKKESELLKQLNLHSVSQEGGPADSNSLQEKLLSVSNELEATKQSLKTVSGELEAQIENHNVLKAEQEKKSSENWVAARQAERNVARVEGEMRVLRNRLTIAESRNSQLLEAMKANPGDPKIKLEVVDNNRPDADSESGTEFQPIGIDLPPLPGFTGVSLYQSPPLPGILKPVPTIIPHDMKDARQPSLHRRSNKKPLPQYSSCPGSPSTAQNGYDSWYRSESRSPSSSRTQTNSQFPSKGEDSHSPYRTESRPSYRTDSQSSHPEDSSSHRADSRSRYIGKSCTPNRKDSPSQYIGKACTPNRQDSPSRYIGKSCTPNRKDSPSRYIGKACTPNRKDSPSQYMAEYRSPYMAESRSTGLSNQRQDIQQ